MELDAWTQAVLNARPRLTLAEAYPPFAARAPIAARVMDSDALQMLAAFDAPVLALTQVLRHELDYTRQVPASCFGRRQVADMPMASRQFVRASRMLADMSHDARSSRFRYTTLAETKAYMATHGPPRSARTA